jgi:DNA end-binding protein Ku
MARALWKGAISFGLVNVPVELYPAEDRKTFKFSMLDKRDLTPVGYKRYSKETGKEVAWDDIVKGYEYEKDRYVVLSDEDFRRANVKATQTIDIQAFVDENEVPAEYYESPYYIAPAARGEKVYALLRETLKSAHRIAIAQVVIRTTQHLAAVVPHGRALMLITLRYADELRPASGIDLPPEGLKSAGVNAKEVALAKRLVDDMTERWNPAAYKDTYHADLMARIKEKIKQGQTKEITKPEAGEERTPRSAQIIDLADLLKQSLGKGAARKASVRKEHAQSSAQSAAPSLHVVGGTKSAGKRAAKPAARRRRA